MSDVFFSQEKFRELLTVIENEPTSENFARLAREYNYRSYYDLAIESARHSIEKDGLNWAGWYELILASGFKNYKELEGIKAELDVFLESANGTGRLEVGLLRNLALINYFLEQDALAMNLVEQAIKDAGEDDTCQEVKGYIFHAMGKVPEALQTFGESVRLNPRNCRSMRMIGKCYLDLGEGGKGIAKITESLRIEPCFVAAWHLLGEYHLDHNNILGGIQSFARARSINPRDWGAYFLMAEFFMSRGDYDIAIAEIKKLFLFEDDKEIRAEALNLIGYAHYLQGNFDDAGYYFNTAIAFNPSYALGHFNLGELERSRGNFEKAVHFYQEALKRDPHHIPSITQTGFAFLNLKKMDQAEEMFQIAVELDPEESSAYLGLSECSRSKRRYSEQLAYVKMAQKILPENSQMLNYMGIAYQCNQNFNQAEQAYLASLKTDPHNRKTANNLAYLYEKKYKRAKSKKEKSELKAKAIAAWEVRLLACRSAGTSIRGAQNHLRNFGITDKEIDILLRLGDVTELPLIQQLQDTTFDLD